MAAQEVESGPQISTGANTQEAQAAPVNCAVCGSSAARAVWMLSDDLLHYPGQYRVVRCDVCGTLRVSPRIDFSRRRLAFSDDYPLFDWALGRKKASTTQRIARFSAQINQINQRHAPGRLLDVGCGDGYFMLGMKDSGWQVKGMELHEGVAAFAREQLGLDVMPGAEHEVDWGGEYDCITVLGVLEDVDDPGALLERCHEHLADGGLLVVQTHNIASWEARYFGPHWFNVEAPRHVWHFSPRTLKQLLRKYRFAPEDLLQYGSTYVTERSIENKRGKPFPSSTADRLLRKAVVQPAARLLPRLGQGIMIEAYCRKAGRSQTAAGPRL